MTRTTKRISEFSKEYELVQNEDSVTGLMQEYVPHMEPDAFSYLFVKMREAEIKEIWGTDSCNLDAYASLLYHRKKHFVYMNSKQNSKEFEVYECEDRREAEIVLANALTNQYNVRISDHKLRKRGREHESGRKVMIYNRDTRPEMYVSKDINARYETQKHMNEENQERSNSFNNNEYNRGNICPTCKGETDGSKYKYCEKCCPHEADYDTYEGGINSCQDCGSEWQSHYDRDEQEVESEQ